MAMQILRYGALALVSACLVMIALVIGGLVPLETVRGLMAKVPALVQVTPEKRVEVAKVDEATLEDAGTGTENTQSDEVPTQPDTNAVPVPETDDASKAVSSKTDHDANKAETETASEETAVPAFDVLRVERDGSTVVAGRAAPNSKIELRASDGTLIGSGRAAASGDFVIVPDKPLPGGDYSLSLVVVDGDGKETVSAETATVSVPDGDGGDVLAMISKPGEASRIIAKPETLKADEAEAVESNDETSIADSSGEATEKSESASGSENSANEKEPTKEEVATAEPEADEKTGTKDGEEPSSTSGTDSEAGADETAAEQEAPAAIVRVEAVEIERDQIFIAGAATRGSTVRIYIDDKPVGEARGTSDDRFLVTRRFKLKPGPHTVRADSIDNATGKVVARAEVPLLHEPVEEVAAADDTENRVGGSSQNLGGRETTKPEIADTEIATDGKTTGTEADETEIPLVKPDVGTKSGSENKTPIANAPENSVGNSANRSSDQERPEDSEKTATDNPGVTTEVSNVKKTDVSEGLGNSQSNDSRSGTEASDQRVVLANPDDKTSKDATKENEGVSIGAPKNETATPDQSDINGKANMVDVVTKDAVDTTEERPTKELKPANVEVVETPAVAPEDIQVNEPREIAAAELAEEIEGAPDGTIRTGTSVIIKPGDNLWRISRKTYGRGIRYTTIYEANKDQIRNPNLIYIGQIFKIPDRPDEELVEADG